VDTARIAALLEPFVGTALTDFQLQQISTYIDLLQHWNARINLTAIRNEEEIIPRHFGESLFMARHLFAKTSCHPEQSEGPHPPQPCHPERSEDMRGAHVFAESQAPYLLPDSKRAEAFPQVLDIGSGAGFPALPLKLWAPQIHLAMIESNHKKAAFLREVARTLTLTNVNVITERTEALLQRQTAPKADVVTLRAVEHFEAILPQAIAFLAPAGRLALLISESQLLSLTTLKWSSPIPIPNSVQKILAIGEF
jgi:16S rRNA (guanine527-N7)-methyltransferase